MAGSLTVALRAAQSGLQTTQSAINATANNIANVNTEGYSRKLVSTETRILAGTGSGVQLSEITRAVDEGLLKDLRRETQDAEKLAIQVSYFDRISAVFGTPESNSSISHVLNEMNEAAESLALSPNGTIEQAEFVRWAEEASRKLANMSEEIQSLRLNADQETSDTVDRINLLTEEIASLNNKIIRNRAVTHNVTDLEDRRDIALNELSKLIDINYYTRGDGDVVVFASNGATLVDRESKPLTHTAAASVGVSSTYAEGDIKGIYTGTEIADNDITSEITGGAIAGLIEQRDEVLPALQAQLDELASDLRDVVNQIHNRGAPYPGLQTVTGTRSFIDSADQTLQLDPTSTSDDVVISLFDVNGDQQASTTLNTIMTSGIYGSGAQTSHGAWSIDEVAKTVEDWLQASGTGSATVSVNSSGKFAIELSSSTHYVAFRDQSATANGSTHEDAVIKFDSNGDGTADETHNGFSSFLGLNDFFVDGSSPDALESATLSSSWASTGATLKFYQDSSGVGTGTEIGTVTVDAASSLTTVAKAINDADIGVTASVIPDGTGQRLRVIHDTGENMVVTQGSSDTLLTDISLTTSNGGVGGSLDVREDIKTTSSLVASAKVQWDADKGQYLLSRSDNSNIKDLATSFQSENNFETSGGLGALKDTFHGYASSVLGLSASKADDNNLQLETAETLVDSLKFKSESYSGVSIDEEMSNLILYQQAYSASARVLSVIQTLFDKLDSIIR